MDTPSKNQDKSQNNVEDIANQKEDLEKPKDFSTEVSKLLEVLIYLFRINGI